MIQNLLASVIGTNGPPVVGWSPHLDLDCDLAYNYVSSNMEKVWCNQDLDLDEIEKPEFVEPTPDRLKDLMRRIPFEGDDWQ